MREDGLKKEEEEKMREEVCVLVVCGVPGSGKSTYSHWLQEMMMRKGMSAQVLSFDDHQLPSHLWDDNSFMQSREAGLSALTQVLLEGKHSVIIVDDIMFFSSMRRRVYQLAREHDAAYAVQWVEVPEAVAFSRNSLRPPDTRVKEEALKRMVEKFEKPLGNDGWERVVETIDGTCVNDDNRFLQTLQCINRAKVVSIQRQADLEKEAMRRRDQQQSLEEREQIRQQLSSNNSVERGAVNPLPSSYLIQTLDLKIREEIADLMKQEFNQKSLMQELARSLGELKKKAIAHARAQLKENSDEEYHCVDAFLAVYFFGYFKSSLVQPTEV